MELLDIINEKGKIIGTKERKQIYQDGDLHRTVHIWVINSAKEILVQKRSSKKDTFPNLWAISTAGHVKTGENSVETALRELREELGIKKDEKDLEYLFSVRRKQEENGMHINTLDDVYLIEEDLDVDNTKLQFSELTDIKYVYYEYLEQIFKNNDPDYVPRTEEHDLLFKYLHDRFDEHDNMKILYKTEFEYNYSEHMKINKINYEHSAVYLFIKYFTIIYVFLAGGTCLITKDIDLLFLIILFITIYVLFIILLPKYRAKKLFATYKIGMDQTVLMTFYEEYFVAKSKQSTTKVFYNQLYKAIETNDNYYLFISSNSYFAVAKNNIESSFNTYIKNKVTCPYKNYSRR